MWRAIGKWLSGGVILASALLVAGFMIFAAVATRPLPDVSVNADAIVVLTGGANRISAGAELLRQNRGQRLLISGINQKASSRDLLRLTGLNKTLFDCCVDLGYDAQTTVGNALETRNWLQKHSYKSLIVVTSRFHMPRSLAELRRAVPDIDFRPYPIAPRRRASIPWWQDSQVAITLVGEYLKFLPAAGRYIAALCLRKTSDLTNSETPPNPRPTNKRDVPGST